MSSQKRGWHGRFEAKLSPEDEARRAAKRAAVRAKNVAAYAEVEVRRYPLPMSAATVKAVQDEASARRAASRVAGAGAAAPSSSKPCFVSVVRAAGEKDLVYVKLYGPGPKQPEAPAGATASEKEAHMLAVEVRRRGHSRCVALIHGTRGRPQADHFRAAMSLPDLSDEQVAMLQRATPGSREVMLDCFDRVVDEPGALPVEYFADAAGNYGAGAMCVLRHKDVPFAAIHVHPPDAELAALDRAADAELQAYVFAARPPGRRGNGGHRGVALDAEIVESLGMAPFRSRAAANASAAVCVRTELGGARIGPRRQQGHGDDLSAFFTPLVPLSDEVTAAREQVLDAAEPFVVGASSMMKCSETCPRLALALSPCRSLPLARAAVPH